MSSICLFFERTTMTGITDLRPQVPDAGQRRVPRSATNLLSGRKSEGRVLDEAKTATSPQVRIKTARTVKKHVLFSSSAVTGHVKNVRSSFDFDGGFGCWKLRTTAVST